MEPWLQDIFDWLPAGGAYYAVVGAVAFVESLAILGIFCPGSVLIVLAGFLAAHGKGDFRLVFAVSALGAVAGDLLSYLLGARLGGVLVSLPVLQKRKELLRKSEFFFLRHGGKSVFFGRFVGFLRPFIPLIAGSSRMRPLPFASYALISGLLWGLAYPGLGYFFGASWKLVRLWTGRFSLLLTVLLLLVVLNGLFWKRLIPRLAPRCNALWNRLSLSWQQLLQRPAVLGFAYRHPRLWSFLAGRFSLQHGSGLYLTVGFATSLFFSLLFLWLAADLPWLDRIDHRIYDLLREAQQPLVTTCMLGLTALANGPVIFMLGGLTLFWLLLGNRDFSAVILVSGLGGGELLVFLLKFLIDRPRPVPFLAGLHPVAAGMPSAHAFTALVLCGLVVYFLLGTVGNWRSRLTLILSGSFLASLVGLSRIYLGVHWLSDVLAGFALAAVWLTFLVTASEMRRRYGGEFPWRTGWQPLHLSRPGELAAKAASALGAAVWTVLYLLDYLARF